MNPLLVLLQRLRRRITVARWIHAVMYGQILALSLAASWMLIAKLFPRVGPPMPVCLTVVIVSFLVSCIYAWIKRPSILDSALAADLRLNLDERLTSSLQLQGVDHPMVDALHVDARQHLTGHNLSKAFPMAGDRALRWVYVPLAAFAVACFLPTFDLLGHDQRVAEARAKEQAVRVQAERLREAVPPPVTADTVPADALLQDLAREIEQVAGDLENQRINNKQALARRKR